MHTDEYGTEYRVLINQEGQYSLWPAPLAIPAGWEPCGEADAKEACLDYIARNWTDMRPRSLRERAQQSSTETP